MSLDKAGWVAYLASVDAVAVEESIRVEIAEFFLAQKIVTHGHLEGLDSTDLLAEQGAPTTILAKGLIRRAVATSTSVAEAKRRGTSAVVPPPEADAATSALSVANALAPPARPTVDVANLLSDAGLGTIPYQIQAEQDIFSLLVDERQKAQAATPPRTEVTFVDLTARGTLPLWVPSDAIGGKAPVPGDADLLPGDSTTTTLSQLGAALRGATAAPRFFRTLAQWSGAWIRFSTAATASKQWTLAQCLTHLDTIMQLGENLRTAGESPYIALIYDEMARRSWESRARRRDTTFDLSMAVVEVNPPILASARARVAATLRAAGVVEISSAASSQPAPSPTGIESLLAKQQSAIDALSRKTDTMSRAVQKGQSSSVSAAAEPDRGGKGGKRRNDADPQDQWQGKSSKQQKKEDFVAKRWRGSQPRGSR